MINQDVLNIYNKINKNINQTINNWDKIINNININNFFIDIKNHFFVINIQKYIEENVYNEIKNDLEIIQDNYDFKNIQKSIVEIHELKKAYPELNISYELHYNIQIVVYVEKLN